MNGADTNRTSKSSYLNGLLFFFKINERVSGSYRLFVSNLRFLHIGAGSSANSMDMVSTSFGMLERLHFAGTI